MDTKIENPKEPNMLKRVVDCMDPDGTPTWGKSDNPRWWRTVVSYDKNFRFLERCIQYDLAMKINDTQQALEHRDEIFKIIEKAYDEFAKSIDQDLVNNPERNKITDDYTVKEFMDKVHLQIQAAAKDMDKNPREVMEIALFKLSLLRDIAKLGFVGKLQEDLMSNSHMFSREKSMKRRNREEEPTFKERSGHCISNWMNLEGTEFKKEIGLGFISPIILDIKIMNTYNALTQEVSPVIPFYSTNSSMGFNTVLCALFNDYLPVCFGVDPMAVHAGYHEQQSLWTTRHDYGHCFNRVLRGKENDPALFNYCKRVYFELFNEKREGIIDDITLKKELLALFLIIYELGGVGYGNAKKAISSRTLDLNDALTPPTSPDLQEYHNLASQYQDRKKLTKHERKTIDDTEKKKMKDAMNRLTILETIDFVKPLQELGYQFPDSIQKKPWGAASALRKALLEVLDEFAERHPEFANENYSSATINPTSM